MEKKYKLRAEEGRKAMEEGKNVSQDQNNDYYLKVAGITINDFFQVVDAYGAFNNRIYIMAVPYIGGYNLNWFTNEVKLPLTTFTQLEKRSNNFPCAIFKNFVCEQRSGSNKYFQIIQPNKKKQKRHQLLLRK